MYERLTRAELKYALPFPFTELADNLDGQPITPLLLRTILGTLLAQSAGLAAVIYAASRSEDTAEQDVTQAMHVLAEYLGTMLAVWRHCEEEHKDHDAGKEDG